MVVRWIAFAVILGSSNLARAAEAATPNLILFLVDDLGWQDTSVPFWRETTPQNEHFRTPNMERMAAAGIKFTQAYTCTVCSPTRTSWMTGYNAARHRVTNWTLDPDRETSGTTARFDAPRDWRREGLQPGEVTLPALLRDRLGYRTIHVGKAHWGASDTPGSDPTRLGFDVNIAGHAAGGPGHYSGTANYGNKSPGQHTRPWGVPGLEKYHGSDVHLTDALTLEANSAVTDAVTSGQPFFLYMAHYAVHAPIQPHPRFVDLWNEKHYKGTDQPIPPVEINYASMVAGIDASLGAIWSHVEQLGVADNTLIVFMSDNGGLSHHARGRTPMGTGRDTHCWPLREGKGSAYEGGTRVPLLVAWAKPNPDQPAQQRVPIAAHSTNETQVIVEDLFPTLLDIAGGIELLQTITPRDGVDFTPALSGAQVKESDGPARPLIFHYPHQWTGKVEGGYQPHSAIRLGDWKAIYFYEGNRWELYQLTSDLGETRNVAGEHPDILAELAGQLQQRLDDMNATWPEERARHRPSRLRRPAEIVYPQTNWEKIEPAEAGLSLEQLTQVADYLGGRGFVTYDGREVFSWGDATRPSDVASAVKPVLTHFLIEAVESGQLESFETPLAKFETRLLTLNRELGFKDAQITFRHCANQTSCYGVSERPGEAFDYNDFQMALFFDTLVNRVFGVETSRVDQDLLGPRLTDVVGCQDRPSLLAMGDSDRAGRLRISPRDFCRFGLLYLRDGNWQGRPVIAPVYAHTVTRSPLPNTLPRTQAREAELITGQRSLGSMRIPDDQTDHHGSYSWLWWVNGQRKSGKRFWPDAPDDTFACLGHQHGMRGMAVVPAWQLVFSWNDSELDRKPWENPAEDPHPLNEVFRLLKPAAAAGDHFR